MVMNGSNEEWKLAQKCSTIKKLLQGGERTEGGDTLYNWYTNTTKKKEETSKVPSSSWLLLIISLDLTLMKIIVLVTLPPHSTFSPFSHTPFYSP